MATKKRVTKNEPAAPKKAKKAAQKPEKKLVREAAKPAKTKPAKRAIALPLRGVPLDDSEEREAALDLLCDFIVRELPASEGDEDREREVLVVAITSFYDVREAAEQERGEYAGHFYMVDGVGIDDSDREVAWNRLREVADAEAIARWEELFEEAERAAE